MNTPISIESAIPQRMNLAMCAMLPEKPLGNAVRMKNEMKKRRPETIKELIVMKRLPALLCLTRRDTAGNLVLAAYTQRREH